MDYKEVLRSELDRDAYVDERREVVENIAFNFPDYLLNHVPDEGGDHRALHGLGSRDGNMPLLPIRAYLQTKLMVTSQRLEELITDNNWLHA